MNRFVAALAVVGALSLGGCGSTPNNQFDPQDGNGAGAGAGGGAAGTTASPAASSASSGSSSSSGSSGSTSTSAAPSSGSASSTSGASSGGSGSSGLEPTVTTLAGNGTLAFADGTGGPSGTAEFDTPEGVAVDASGNLYVADTNNHRVRKIDPSGNVTTLAGNGTPGWVDGTGGPSGTAEFGGPEGVAVDAAGNVYVGDTGARRVRKIDPSGNVTTLAGNGTQGFADGSSGPTGTAEFDSPEGVAVDATGNVYVADLGNGRVRKIDSAGNVTTLAGNGTQGFFDGTGGPSGTAEFESAAGVAVDSSGNVYVADYGRIRKIDASGNVTTVAGNGTYDDADGTGGLSGTAAFQNAEGVAIDAAGNVYVGDNNDNRIRKVDASGNVTTLAGNGMPGFADGSGGRNGTAEFNSPIGVAVDATGNVYVADPFNGRIRKIVP